MTYERRSTLDWLRFSKTRKHRSLPCDAEGQASPQLWTNVAPVENRVARLPHFRGSARDQLHGTARGRFAQMRLSFRSIFTPSQPVVERERFAGREDALRMLIAGVEDPRLPAVIYGDRGTGKTSPPHILSGDARDAGCLVPLHRSGKRRVRERGG